MRLHRSRRLEQALAGVYGVAVAAAADEQAAADAIVHVFEEDGSRLSGDLLAARVVRRAVLEAPDAVLATIDASDREAVALARLLGWPVSRVADELRLDAGEVRLRLTRGLRAVAAQAQPVAA